MRTSSGVPPLRQIPCEPANAACAHSALSGLLYVSVVFGALRTMNGQPDSKEGVALSLLKTQLALSPKELRLIISKTRNDPRRVGKALA